LDGNAALEVVDDVIICDIEDGGSCVEESFDVGSDGSALLLLAHRQSMSGWWLHKVYHDKQGAYSRLNRSLSRIVCE
jgi:hypothetical protein